LRAVADELLILCYTALPLFNKQSFMQSASYCCVFKNNSKKCIFFSSVLQFHVRHFHVLPFNALHFYVMQVNSLQLGPSISGPAVLMVRYFHVRHFQSTRPNLNAR